MNWQEVYNKLSDDLVNAFNFFMGNMKLTKVFKATIIEKINDTVYKVSYKNAEYKVKSYYDLIIGDIVWVCAPGGDWDSLFVQSYNGFLDRIITTDKVVNNLTTNVAGTVLDGRMGKSLKDQLEQQNSNLALKANASDLANYCILAGGKTMYAQDDLNSYLNVGVFHCATSDTAQYISNQPSTSKRAFRMVVEDSAGVSSYRRQTLRYFNDDIVHSRTYNADNHSWSAWSSK